MPNLYGNFENEIETFNSQNVLANFPHFIFYDNDLDLWSKVIKKMCTLKLELYICTKNEDDPTSGLGGVCEVTDTPGLMLL